MKLIDVVKRSGRNLRQAKARTLLTALAVAVGAFALTASFAATAGVRHFTDKLISSNFDPAELIVFKDPTLFGQASGSVQEYDTSFGSSAGAPTDSAKIKRLSLADIDTIRKQPYIQSVREGYNVSLQYITRPGQKKFIGNAEAYNPARKPELAAGSLVGGVPVGKVLLHDDYIKPLGFANPEAAVGQQVTVAVTRPFDVNSVRALLSSGNTTEVSQAAQSQNQLFTFTISGVLKKSTTSQSSSSAGLILSNDDARNLSEFSTQGTADYQKYTLVYARVKDGADKTKLHAAQDQLKAAGFQTQSVEDTQKFITKIINVIQGIAGGFGAIALIASIFGIINTMYISVLERTRDIGLMKALGMRRRDISRLFRIEAGWIGFLGGAMGALLAVGVGTLLNPWLSAQLQLDSGEYILLFQPLPIIGLVVALSLVAIVAGLLPARKAARLDPIEALRTE